ncbi:MAG: electron transport complex subunit RsxA [Xanthomonadales bacterium]|nr:electron transport complex subunit RsxA [Xanthomonadales bacterium]
MTEYALLLIGTVLVNNVVLAKFLGLCPFMGTSRNLDHAVGLALATGLVLTLTSGLCWLAMHWLLAPLGLEYLRVLVFILIIAATVQFTEALLRKLAPVLYQALGIFLPLITTNCAVLGVALLNTYAQRSLFAALLFGAGSALGFGLVLVLFAAARERLDASPVPAAFRGVPIALVSAGLMALAFMGFAGMDR